MFQIVLSVVTLALMIFALIDVITNENWQIQHLPKIIWILLIVILPLIGSVIWLIVGKDRGVAVDRGSFGDPRRHEPQQHAPQRHDPRAIPALDDDEAIEQEIAYHEKQAEIRRLEAELRNRRGDQRT